MTTVYLFNVTLFGSRPEGGHRARRPRARSQSVDKRSASWRSDRSYSQFYTLGREIDVGGGRGCTSPRGATRVSESLSKSSTALFCARKIRTVHGAD